MTTNTTTTTERVLIAVRRRIAAMVALTEAKDAYTRARDNARAAAGTVEDWESAHALARDQYARALEAAASGDPGATDHVLACVQATIHARGALARAQADLDKAVSAREDASNAMCAAAEESTAARKEEAAAIDEAAGVPTTTTEKEKN